MLDVDEAFRAGQLAWPGLKLSREAFAERLQRLEVDPQDLAARGSDLYLAAACAAHEPAAVFLFERAFLVPVPRQLGRVALRDHEEDELRQQLRVKLLVGPQAKIAEYRGSGPLGAWVRVCALRLALDLKLAPEVSKRADGRALDALVGSSPEAESLLDTEQHREVFQEALKESLDMLSSREKTLLRLHFIDGMTIDALGVLFCVHRATAARWLVAIRTRVMDHLRERLSKQLGTSPSEAQSLVRLLRSQAQVSIDRLLGDEAPADD